MRTRTSTASRVFAVALCMLVAIPLASFAAETYTKGDTFGGGTLNNPLDAAVGHAGRIYVADQLNDRIVRRRIGVGRR
jgi:hypothetical protein